MDPAQETAVRAGVRESLFIVAGPGSGKTTVLTLRLLKLVFVDDVDPAAILATTFTRKAAEELRSRILGWGDQVRRALLTASSTSQLLADRLRSLDLNRVITGTLDSIAEQALTDFRAPGTQPPIPLEEFVADAIMQRSGLWQGRRDRDPGFQAYAQCLLGGNRSPNQREMLDICRDVRDRFIHDQINAAAFRANVTPQHPGAAVLCDAIADYESKLITDLVMDFAALEQEFLNRLNTGLLKPFVKDLRILLVDEYQDTNLLQEQIYFALARHVGGRRGAIAVVGDDDQSLYRFRGATVELFSEFPQRLQSQCGMQARTIYLSNNYRSTNAIVNCCTDFVTLDPIYSSVRVSGKPQLSVARSGSFVNYPVLGLFRPDVSTLARDLASLIDDVFKGNGVIATSGGQRVRIIKEPHRGDVGDCALLCSSPREYSGTRVRLPLLLRNELKALAKPIRVFNPRGQEFSEIEVIEHLCGLMLECIDPDARVQSSIQNLPTAVTSVFDRWRAAATQFVTTNPLAPNPPAPRTTRPDTLSRFVRAWKARTPQGHGTWPREVPLIQLMYELITWIPVLQQDPEGLVYLEVVTRTITQSARFIAYDATIQRDQPQADASVKAVLWGIFEPIASGAIDVDEELIESLPRDRLNILSIHQAKGLEFPLVIVDVGSDFKTNNWMQAFKRYPRGGSRPHNLEDMLRPFSPLGAPIRTGRDRAFDDLIRQYFVAFSRPQDVLLLVGLSPISSGPNSVPNVATGWTRSGQRPGLPGVVYL